MSRTSVGRGQPGVADGRSVVPESRGNGVALRRVSVVLITIEDMKLIEEERVSTESHKHVRSSPFI